MKNNLFALFILGFFLTFSNLSFAQGAWIPGHYGPGGGWVPGHYVGVVYDAAPGLRPCTSGVWIPGHYGPLGGWHPGHWNNC